MKVITIVGQLGGFVSSILLAWGYAPAKGTMTWTTGDGSAFRKDQPRRVLMVRIGYVLLAISFLIGAIVTYFAIG
jgi:hypothetical protein